jgi:CheY-like chemotaxis protein
MANILIVEDDPVSAEAAAVICKAARHTVTVVGDGLSALLALDTEPFDMILADVMMPRMDGLAMTRAIRTSNQPYAGIPILGFTGRVGREHVAAMLDAGMDDVVPKPFRNRTLVEAIAQLLKRGSYGVVITGPATVEQENAS